MEPVSFNFGEEGREKEKNVGEREWQIDKQSDGEKENPVVSWRDFGCIYS